MSELSGSLLQVMLYETRSEKKGLPLMMEFPVNPQLAQFLVSSAKGTLWVGSRNGIVRAALRKTTLDSYFVEAVRSITNMGRKMEWGNVAPLNTVGLITAMQHVQSYGLTELEILAHPQFAWGTVSPDFIAEDRSMILAMAGLPVQPALWMPLDTLVVVPKDREYVGFSFLFQEHLASVIHNASRGVGIATSWEE